MTTKEKYYTDHFSLNDFYKKIKLLKTEKKTKKAKEEKENNGTNDSIENSDEMLVCYSYLKDIIREFPVILIQMICEYAYHEKIIIKFKNKILSRDSVCHVCISGNNIYIINFDGITVRN